jgi:hypothetical protein
MKHALKMSFLSLTILLGPIGSTSAHQTPFTHFHTASRYHHMVHRKPVVYRPKGPQVVVLMETQRTAQVIRTTRGRVSPPSVMRRQPAAQSQASPWAQPLSVGVRASGAVLDGGKIGLSKAENPLMGGVGFQFRPRFTSHWGMELSVDFMTAEVGAMDQTAIPVMAALTYHFLPSSRFQPYLLAGAGVEFTRLEYLDGHYVHDLIEVAGQAGFGAEVFLTRDLSLTGDVRGKFIFSLADEQRRVHTDCLRAIGTMSGFCDGIQSADPKDKLNMGVQFHLGANYYF